MDFQKFTQLRRKKKVNNAWNYDLCLVLIFKNIVWNNFKYIEIQIKQILFFFDKMVKLMIVFFAVLLLMLPLSVAIEEKEKSKPSPLLKVKILI